MNKNVKSLYRLWGLGFRVHAHELAPRNLMVSLVYGWLFLGAGKQDYRDLGSGRASWSLGALGGSRPIHPNPEKPPNPRVWGFGFQGLGFRGLRRVKVFGVCGLGLLRPPARQTVEPPNPQPLNPKPQTLQP